MNPFDYFKDTSNVMKKKYDALREFFFEKRPASDVAKKYNYTLSAFYSLTRDFRQTLKINSDNNHFFKIMHPGRKPMSDTETIDKLIVLLRKKNYSTEDIVIGVIGVRLQLSQL